MKRRGFTLVELLAVIVILAVIAFIATPVVLNMIEEARIGAFKDSVRNAYNAVENKLFMAGLTEIPENGIDVKSLDIKSDFVSGRFMKDEDGTDIAYFIKNSRYCAYGRLDNLEVKTDCDDLDLTYPEIDPDKMVLKSTTESIEVTLQEGIATDIESGIKSYEVVIYLGDEEIASRKVEFPSTMTFNKLSKTTEYRLELIVTNGNNMTSSIEKKKSTEEMNVPEVTYQNTPEEIQNGYLKSQTIKITYPEAKGMTYYVKTTRDGSINKKVTKSCGTETMPKDCNTISDLTTLSANTWYEVESEIELTYKEKSTETGSVIALVSDGTNYGTSATGTIAKIDKTSPVITTTSVTNNTNRTVLAYKITEEESQVSSTTCKYGLSEGNYTKNGSDVTNTGCVLSGLTSEQTYYYQVCSTDKVGNTGCMEGNSKTETITNPTVSFESIPDLDTNGYTKKQVATVTFTKGNINEPKYYIKSERIGVSSENVSLACGSGSVPGDCSSITKTTSLNADTWYQVSGNVEVTYTEPSAVTNSLYAITYDGTNFSGSTAGTIGKIYYEASDVDYSNNGVSNVQEALDELYDIYMK